MKNEKDKFLIRYYIRQTQSFYNVGMFCLFLSQSFYIVVIYQSLMTNTYYGFQQSYDLERMGKTFCN